MTGMKSSDRLTEVNAFHSMHVGYNQAQCAGEVRLGSQVAEFLIPISGL
jgi:hypothetical protein